MLDIDLKYKKLGNAKNMRGLEFHNPQKLDPNLFGNEWRLMYKHEIKAHKPMYVGIIVYNDPKYKLSFSHNGNFDHSMSYFRRIRTKLLYNRGYDQNKILECFMQGYNIDDYPNGIRYHGL